ncbi:hypothetical protein VTO42DRAFT_2724 [Malbranchea cinnamomea]
MSFHQGSSLTPHLTRETRLTSDIGDVASTSNCVSCLWMPDCSWLRRVVLTAYCCPQRWPVHQDKSHITVRPWEGEELRCQPERGPKPRGKSEKKLSHDRFPTPRNPDELRTWLHNAVFWPISVDCPWKKRVLWASVLSQYSVLVRAESVPLYTCLSTEYSVLFGRKRRRIIIIIVKSVVSNLVNGLPLGQDRYSILSNHNGRDIEERERENCPTCEKDMVQAIFLRTRRPAHRSCSSTYVVIIFPVPFILYTPYSLIA